MKLFAIGLLVLSLVAAAFSAPAPGTDTTTADDETNPQGRFFIDYFLDSSSESCESDSKSSSSSEEHHHHHYYQVPTTTCAPVVVPT